MNRQRGGTFLGLIIGALIGLGAALAVAVYVTKVPVPFMNKSQTRNPDSDAAEAKKNKDWNPNAPLAGKKSGTPPPPPAAPSPDPVLTPAPNETTAITVPDPVKVTPPKVAPPKVAVTTPVSPPAAPTAKTSKPAPSADPLGDLAKAKSKVPETLTASIAADPFNYFVQAGAFRTPEDAEQQRARLLLLGIQAKVSEREQSGRTVYRVRIGPFEKKEEADKAKDRLDNNSIETALVRVQR